MLTIETPALEPINGKDNAVFTVMMLILIATVGLASLNLFMAKKVSANFEHIKTDGTEEL